MHNSLHNRLHATDPTTWLHMHSLPKAELCLRNLQLGDNLINRLSVISTLNRWCLCQIAFLSSSLGLKKKTWTGLFDCTDAFIFCPGIPCLQSNKCVSVWVVHACLHLISSPSNSVLSVYSFIKPNHPTCCKPQSVLPCLWLHRSKNNEDESRSKAEQGVATPACCGSVKCSISPTGGYTVVVKCKKKYSSCFWSVYSSICRAIDVREWGSGGMYRMELVAMIYCTPGDTRVSKCWTRWDSAVGCIPLRQLPYWPS